MMAWIIKLGILVMIFLPVSVTGQSSDMSGDTLRHEMIIMEVRSGYQQSQPIALRSDNEYFEFYNHFFGAYPQNFKFDFENKMIVVLFKTLTSGSFHLSVDHVIETEEKILVKTHIERPPNGYSQDMKPVFTVFSLKRSDKLIEVD